MNITNIPSVLVVGTGNSKSTYPMDILYQMEARGEIKLVYQTLEACADTIGLLNGYACADTIGLLNGYDFNACIFDEYTNYGDVDFALAYGATPTLKKKYKKRAIKPYFRHNQRY